MKSPSTGFKRQAPAMVAVAALAVYWLLLFVATHLPLEHVPGPVNHHDKAIHFVAYGGLAFLLTVVQLILRGFRWRLLTGVLVVVAVYGVFDELTQLMVGRSADVVDWVADLLGALAGVGLGVSAWLFWRSLRKVWSGSRW